MIKYITLYFFILSSLFCCKKPFITITRSKATPKKVIIYPPEKSEIATMEIGDTINIFYKKTGWYKSKYTNYGWYKTSFYSIETIWRVDTGKYLYTTRWAYPDKWFGMPLEFDSLKNHPDELFRTIGRLEFECITDTIIKWDGNYENCIRQFKHSPNDSLYFADMKSRELTSSKYQKWRFSPPTRQELNQWRTSIPEYSNVYRYEMIVISKDTIKLSYSDKIGAQFALVFPE